MAEADANDRKSVMTGIKYQANGSDDRFGIKKNKELRARKIKARITRQKGMDRMAIYALLEPKTSCIDKNICEPTNLLSYKLLDVFTIGQKIIHPIHRLCHR